MVILRSKSGRAELVGLVGLVGIMVACSSGDESPEQAPPSAGGAAGAGDGGEVGGADSNGASETGGGASDGGSTANGGASGGGSTSGGGASGGVGGRAAEIDACPRLDDEPPGVTVLAPGEGSMDMLAVVDGQVYYFSWSELMRVPVAGAEPELLGAVGTNQRRRAPLLSRDQRLVWAEAPLDEPYAIYTAPLQAPTDVTPIIEGLSQVEYLALDETHVYWSDNESNEVYRAPLAGGEPETVVNETQVLDHVVNEGHYYWLDFGTMQLERVPVGGGTREALTSASHGSHFVSGPEGVFWASGVSTQILSHWDGTSQHSLLSTFDVEGLALADGRLYWPGGISIPGGGRTNAVWNMATDGSDPEALLCYLGKMNGIALDADSVYVAAAYDGVLKIAR